MDLPRFLSESNDIFADAHTIRPGSSRIPDRFFLLNETQAYNYFLLENRTTRRKVQKSIILGNDGKYKYAYADENKFYTEEIDPKTTSLFIRPAFYLYLNKQTVHDQPFFWDESSSLNELNAKVPAFSAPEPGKMHYWHKLEERTLNQLRDHYKPVQEYIPSDFVISMVKLDYLPLKTELDRANLLLLLGDSYSHLNQDLFKDTWKWTYKCYKAVSESPCLEDVPKCILGKGLGDVFFKHKDVVAEADKDITYYDHWKGWRSATSLSTTDKSMSNIAYKWYMEGYHNAVKEYDKWYCVTNAFQAKLEDAYSLMNAKDAYYSSTYRTPNWMDCIMQGSFDEKEDFYCTFFIISQDLTDAYDLANIIGNFTEEICSALTRKELLDLFHSADWLDDLSKQGRIWGNYFEKMSAALTEQENKELYFATYHELEKRDRIDVINSSPETKKIYQLLVFITNFIQDLLKQLSEK